MFGTLADLERCEAGSGSRAAASRAARFEFQELRQSSRWDGKDGPWPDGPMDGTGTPDGL